MIPRSYTIHNEPPREIPPEIQLKIRYFVAPLCVDYLCDATRRRSWLCACDYAHSDWLREATQAYSWWCWWGRRRAESGGLADAMELDLIYQQRQAYAVSIIRNMPHRFRTIDLNILAPYGFVCNVIHETDLVLWAWDMNTRHPTDFSPLRSVCVLLALQSIVTPVDMQNKHLCII